jgi:cell wall-associated NlpC family hydrolase
MSTYGIAALPTPLFSSPDLKSVEFIALPQTKLTLLKEVAPNIAEATTLEYPSSTPIYVDTRFLEKGDTNTPEREKELPSVDSILNFMTSLVGTRYFWGGNWAEGIPEMELLYPEKPVTDDLICKGVDCSGLLYQATNGFTPRNTSQLYTYGVALEIPLRNVKPLDMMVWPGHVLFVLDANHFIESAGGRGVFISNFQERFAHFKDKPFSFRRWHPEMY